MSEPVFRFNADGTTEPASTPSSPTFTSSDAILDAIEQRCLQAVLAGGTTWTRFMADAEHETRLPWPQIKALLDERYADRAAA